MAPSLHPLPSSFHGADGRIMEVLTPVEVVAEVVVEGVRAF